MKKKVKRRFVSFEEAKDYARLLKLNNTREWFLVARPKRIPVRPDLVYKDKGWIDWCDFLGNNKDDTKYVSYEEAKAYAQSQTFKSGREFKRFRGRPNNIPKSPHIHFRDKGWTNWYDFLGKKQVDKKLSFEEARRLTHSLKLKSMKEYLSIVKQYPMLAAMPHLTYKKKGWTSVKDYIGPTWEDKRDSKFRSSKYSEVKKFLDYHATKERTKLFKFFNARHYCLASKLFKDTIFFDMYYEPSIRFKKEGWKDSDVFLKSKGKHAKGYIKQWFRELPLILEEVFEKDPEYKKEFTQRLIAYYTNS